ncbi:CHAT domain-containing protein [Paludisphaera soli]|uniref:CHAT domain-containing protein n=1 Tax=Paludisphaera soli TaxID=2712865 RepID=UPI00197D89FF
MVKILFVASNPKDTDSLRLGEEARTIRERIRLARGRDDFEVHQEFAVRTGDMQLHLLHYSPDIVHFSGHGSPAGQIVFEDHSGYSHPVEPEALERLFTTLRDNVKCVVLNACYSEIQAQAIAKSIDCVVGVARSIADDAAVAFALGFYQGLAYGRSIQTSFDLGIDQIHMASPGQQDRPRLIVKAGVDAGSVYLMGGLGSNP